MSGFLIAEDFSLESPTGDSLVYLVGAGPGDPGLLTLAARECLEAADAVVYDYLASDAVMRFAAPDAERIFVGKKGFSAHVTQEQINALLVEVATREPGRRIVRLKGGDPFVFGRGGEEALALREAGIPFRVVPGITAGVAAPAYAGIPVTHRTHASSVTLITGHETPDKDAPVIDWEHLASPSATVCFYMGVRDLPMIRERLISCGRDPKTPVALVRWGTTPQQETLTATLEDVVEKVERVGFKAPAIICVGEVVELRDRLAWFERSPLFGKSVVVTRSREQASELSAALRALGAEPIEFPTISFAPRQGVLERLAEAGVERSLGDAFDWVVLTSANGVACLMDALAQAGRDARAFAGCRIACIGSGTAAALAARGLVADLVPPRFIAESVASALIEAGAGSGTRVLIPRASQARDALPDLLGQAGAQVTVLPVYDTVVPDAHEQARALVERLAEGSVDAVTFTSSSTARNFCELIDAEVGAERRAELMEGVLRASIGPVTSQTLASLGIPAGAEAETYTIKGLTATLVTAFSEKGE